MGKCKHHPQSSDGVCSSCLEKKLNSVWRGESRLESDPSAPGHVVKHVPDSSKEAIAVLGSIASITKRKHSSKLAKGRDITERPGIDFVLDSRSTDGVSLFRKPAVPPSGRSVHKKATVDGGGKRRSKVSGLVSKKVVGKSVALADAKAGLNAFAGARSVGCRSLPLVDKIAKETALRVIREVGDELSEVGDGVVLETNEQDPRITCFAPSHWQSKLRSKWGLKGLGVPMITGGNKIFPSKSVENVQRLLQAHFSPLREDSRFVSAGDVDRHRRGSDLSSRTKLALAHVPHDLDSDVVIEGMPDRILKPEDMNQRLRTSYNTVLQWLQDLPMPETTLQDMVDGDDPFLSSSFVMEVRNTDLATVGRLHGIAEEHDNLDESSVEEAPSRNHLRDVSSFGKFLIRAAQRKPKQGLSRVASAR